MLSHIRIYKQQQYTCVEELSNEHTIRDRCKLLTLGVMLYRLNQLYNQQFQDGVHSDDNERDRHSKYFRI